MDRTLSQTPEPRASQYQEPGVSVLRRFMAVRMTSTHEPFASVCGGRGPVGSCCCTKKPAARSAGCDSGKPRPPLPQPGEPVHAWP
eukprot:scaffold6766_cov78-Phaeocystis_antarctica.AAC.2